MNVNRIRILMQERRTNVGTMLARIEILGLEVSNVAKKLFNNANNHKPPFIKCI